jgi:chemotaxis response regulator CheB
MGADGLEGARDVRRRGGRVIVEAESTCTVYGMPRAVAEADLAHAVLPLDELPAAIAAEAGEAGRSPADHARPDAESPDQDAGLDAPRR